MAVGVRLEPVGGNSVESRGALADIGDGKQLDG